MSEPDSEAVVYFDVTLRDTCDDIVRELRECDLSPAHKAGVALQLATYFSGTARGAFGEANLGGPDEVLQLLRFALADDGRGDIQ